jgi:hypothetical protein
MPDNEGFFVSPDKVELVTRIESGGGFLLGPDGVMSVLSLYIVGVSLDQVADDDAESIEHLYVLEKDAVEGLRKAIDEVELFITQEEGGE